MLTTAQIRALRAVGEAIGAEWLRAAQESGEEPDPGYDFSGDWQWVREVAVSVGLEWPEGATQPDERGVALALWTAVEEGYRSAIEAGA
jgi:hypothetical protein